MKDIDFLPTRYLQERARRQARVWRLLVLAGVVALVGSGLYTQRVAWRRLDADLTEAEVRRAVVRKQAEHLRAMGEKLAPTKALAGLVTFLRHPWPRSQILAAVLEPLPPSISLDELHILSERNATQQGSEERGAGAPRRLDTGDEPTKTDLLPATEDLRRLVEESGSNQVVVMIHGTTRETSALYAYLATLAGSPLVASAEIEDMSVEDAKDGRQFRFRTRVLMSSCHGQQPMGTRRPTVGLALRSDREGR